MDLCTSADLAKHFGRTTEVIETAAKRAKLETMNLRGEGGAVVACYRKEVAIEALTPILRPAPEATPAPTIPPAVLSSALVPLFERLGSFESKVLRVVGEVDGASEGRQEKALELLGKLVEQNIVLLRTLENLRADVLARMDALQGGLDSLLHPEPLAEPAPAAPATPLPPPPKKKVRVAVVSLLNSQRALIEREFGSLFDLRIMDSEDQRKGGRLEAVVSSCEYLVALTNFITHSTEASARNAGAKLIRVSGGMTALRNALTDLYCETADSAVTA